MDPAGAAEGAIAWLQDNAIVLVFWGIVLLLVYRFAKPIIHRLLVRIMSAPATFDERATSVAGLGHVDRSGEVAKRVATLEDLLSRLLRYGVIIGFLA
jgi:hypothetical protein